MNDFWFTPKLTGYGATPSTWEGYTLVAVFAAVVLFCVVTMLLNEKRRGLEASRSIFPLPMRIVAGSTIFFLIVTAWKTNGSWG